MPHIFFGPEWEPFIRNAILSKFKIIESSRNMLQATDPTKMYDVMFFIVVVFRVLILYSVSKELICANFELADRYAFTVYCTHLDHVSGLHMHF